MKLLFFSILAVAVSIGSGFAWADEMKGMEPKDQPAQAVSPGAPQAVTTHHAVGTVKSVDAAKGTVTISHGAVKSLDWPAMTMTFRVRDAGLMKELAPGRKVEVDFVQDGSDYTIVKVK